MRDYFNPNTAPSSPHWLVMALLAIMLMLLTLAPRLAFAADAMPKHLLSPDDIAQKVSEELVIAGYGDEVDVSVQTDDPGTMFGADEPMTIHISGLTASTDSRQWSANVLFKNGPKVLTALPMKGRFDVMVSLPTLNRPIASSQMIQQSDIAYKSFPQHYQRAGVVADEMHLIGKAAKRNISNNRPIRLHEVASPRVVQKNDLVSLSYNQGNLMISTTGQVMADAAIGDVVAIKNVNSDKTVRAVIRSNKLAEVAPMVQSTAQLSQPNTAQISTAKGASYAR